MNPSALQSRAAWGAHTYSPAFNADPRPHRDFAHAVLHVVKAYGKLARWALGGTLDSYPSLALADVAICLCRAANTVPRVRTDLAAALDHYGDARAMQFAASEDAAGPLAESIGRVAGFLDAMDHDEPFARADLERALADAWFDTTVAARQTGVDLAAAVDARLTEKGLGPR